MSDTQIERLEAELARAGAEHEPPPGWQARVLAAVGAEKPRRRWWWFAVPALAVAAAIVLIVVTRRPAPKPQALALAIDIASGSAVVRGTSAKVGDTVHATASGGRHRAVWIYREDRELVVACPGAAACRATATTLTADAMLRAPGLYTVIALDGTDALPVPTGSLDTDLAAANTAHATSRIETIDVR